MENKENIELIIYRILSGSATEQEQTKFQSWLDESYANRQKYQEYYILWKTLNPPFNPDEINVEKAHDKIGKQIGKIKRTTLSSIIYYWQRIASIILIPLFLILGYLVFDNQENESDHDIIQNISSPQGMTSQVNLPDGSKVWLNGGSQLSYSLNRKAKERTVQLNGEAYFEVRSDKENPFIVKTERATITATGTAFNVEAYSKDSITAVTMTSGIVHVLFGEMKSISMKAGERIHFNNRTTQYELNKTDAYKWYAWKDGLLIFRDDPLSYVFKRLEITFNVEINIVDASIGNLPYRATFEGEPLHEILRLLEMTAPIHFHFAPRIQNASAQFVKPHIEVLKGKSKRKMPPPPPRH
ncbi:MAG: FecR domain-containing protein [Massilibacteroides sp.]|nr:FecR domain-containing protein [Massilibacteroides sp.]